MKIIIKETGKTANLTAIDRSTDCEWTADLIEAGGLEHDEDGITIMTQDDYEWWAKYIRDNEQTEDDAESLADELEENGFDESEHECGALAYVRQMIANNTGNDLDSHRVEAVEAMNDIRRQYLDD
jgi:hypothetical protein